MYHRGMTTTVHPLRHCERTTENKENKCRENMKIKAKTGYKVPLYFQ